MRSLIVACGGGCNYDGNMCECTYAEPVLDETRENNVSQIGLCCSTLLNTQSLNSFQSWMLRHPL